MNLEVESSDVIKLIQQFLKENNLVKTLETLQEESGVALNTVDDVSNLHQNIVHGRWDVVLETIQTIQIPTEKHITLMEQIVLEMAELGESDTARSILRDTAPMQALRRESPQRYRKLTNIIHRPYFESAEAYPKGTNKAKRRHDIAEAIRKEVHTVPPSRLMTLITQSLKWQQYNGQLPKGSKYDLFRGSTPVEKEMEEKPPARNDRIIKFGDKSHAESAVFSPDGQFLVSGTVDGFVEVWDFDTAKLREDLKYQADEQFMLHADSVLCLSFSRDSELLASGSQDGKIKIWQIMTGECVHKFVAAHTKGVTSLEFARDGTQILSASLDETAKIHGLKSGRQLRQFRGHKSFVNKAIYSKDGSKVITGSADGTVKIWDAKTTDCLKTFSPNPSQAREISVLSLSLLPSNPDQLLICDRSPTMYVTTIGGQVIRTYSIHKKTDSTTCFVSYTVSARGNFLFCVDEGKVLYTFNVQSGNLVGATKLHERDVIGLAQHPHRNILASYSIDGTMKLWRP